MSPARQVRRKTPARHAGVVDQDAARDLELTIENDGDLYRQQFQPIVKNLMRKRRAGTYRHDLAVKLFGYLVEAGAKKYAANYGDDGKPWHAMFNVPTRHAVAASMTRSFEREAELGNYDDLLPPTPTRQHVSAVKRTNAQLRHDIQRATGMKVR